MKLAIVLLQTHCFDMFDTAYCVIFGFDMVTDNTTRDNKSEKKQQLKQGIALCQTVGLIRFVSSSYAIMVSSIRYRSVALPLPGLLDHIFPVLNHD